jgi:hypothetical protein
MTASEPWARKLRDQRNIGDFRKWRDHDAYQDSLKRLLGDLTVSATKPQAQELASLLPRDSTFTIEMVSKFKARAGSFPIATSPMKQIRAMPGGEDENKVTP